VRVISACKATILVVDDSEIVLDLCSAALEKAGYRVVTHRRAEGTVGVVLREKPDLILLDVNMPRLTGDKLAGALAVANPDRNTVVLLHSTLPLDVLSEKARVAGAHGCIPKVHDELKLVSTVGEWLRRANSGALRSGSPAQGASVEQTSPLSEPTAALLAAAGSPSPHRLLVVDDEVEILLALRRGLELPGYEVELTVAPELALERILGSRAPDVVVTDILMPRVTGIDLYRRAWHKDPALAARFVFMTAETGIKFVADFLREVGVDVVKKPIDVESLRTAILRKADKRADQRAL
jgi:CheY-like chemotaxis protein